MDALDLSSSEDEGSLPESRKNTLSHDSSPTKAESEIAATSSAVFGGDISSEEEGDNDDVFEQERNPSNDFKQEGLVDENEEGEDLYEVDLEIPETNFVKDEPVYFVKMPNYLTIDSVPFDPSTYQEAENNDHDGDVEDREKSKGSSRGSETNDRLRLKIENTIRWRNVETPAGIEKESNARIVEWSDGSMSLVLNNDYFDITFKDITKEYNHLCVSCTDGMLCEAVLKTKISFTPSSTESDVHRKFTKAVTDRFQKVSKVKTYVTDQDPQKMKDELVKREEERIRATQKRENEKRRLMESGHRQPLSRRYLEPDVDEEDGEEGFEQSLAAIKESFGFVPRKSARSRRMYGSDGEEAAAERNLLEAKTYSGQDDEDDLEGEMQDEIIAPVVKKRKNVVMESDSDE